MFHVSRAAMLGAIAAAALVRAANVPPDATDKSIEYSVTPSITGYDASDPTIDLVDPMLVFYGAPPVSGGDRRKLEFFDLVNAGPLCYSTACASPSPLYPAPNFVLGAGGVTFQPADVAPPDRTQAFQMRFDLAGAVGQGAAGLPPLKSIVAQGLPTAYTGDDPGGATAYLYFVNADGTRTNTLHVPVGAVGGASLQGVILFGAQDGVFDIVGFANPTDRAFITSVPEPATWGTASLALLCAAALRRRAGGSTRP